MKEYTKDYEITNNKTDSNTHIRVSINYELGGMSYISGNIEKRGYYLSVQPIEKQGDFTKYTPSNGYRHFLLEVTRKSERSLEVAKELSRDILEKIFNQYKDIYNL